MESRESVSRRRLLGALVIASALLAALVAGCGSDGTMEGAADAQSSRAAVLQSSADGGSGNAYFTVNTTGDEPDANPGDGACLTALGTCTLRSALEEANAFPGRDTIFFAIPGLAPFTISPASSLPIISDPVVIDGSSQPGFAGTPVIELSGSNIDQRVGADGLAIIAGGSEVRSLVINDFMGPVGVGSGISLFGPGGNLIEGNFIGTDVNGTVSRGNRRGVLINNSAGNIVGGTNPGARNLISGNNFLGGPEDGAGVLIAGTATMNSVQGNLIGTDVSGTLPLGNQRGVLLLSGPNGNTLGGTLPGAGNTIAFNTRQGVGLLAVGAGTVDNAIRGNSIFLNGGLGIDLGPNDFDGVTPNVLGDADLGPNNLQNFPVLASVLVASGTTVIRGTLNSTSNTTFDLELFTNDVCDPLGFGEGERFLTTTQVTTNRRGNASFVLVLRTSLLRGQVVTATATDPGGNTSEFSACREVQGQGP